MVLKDAETRVTEENNRSVGFPVSLHRFLVPEAASDSYSTNYHQHYKRLQMCFIQRWSITVFFAVFFA